MCPPLVSVPERELSEEHNATQQTRQTKGFVPLPIESTHRDPPSSYLAGGAVLSLVRVMLRTLRGDAC